MAQKVQDAEKGVNPVNEHVILPDNAAGARAQSGLAKRFSPFVESRGIERVLPSETRPLRWQSQLQAFALWVSINLAAVNITLGMLAPIIFELGFLDASLCAVFGSLLGSVPVSYIATWGPKSGLRTMVSATEILSSCTLTLKSVYRSLHVLPWAGGR